MTGIVHLVGAGPGAADLLTLRAARLLADADVVLYDALVDPSVLALAPNAKLYNVGKRAGRPSTDQRFICRLLVRMAQRYPWGWRRGGRPVSRPCADRRGGGWRASTSRSRGSSWR